MDASHNSRETTLGECANWFSGGTPRKSREEFWGGDIPWASAKDMKEFRLYDTEDHITQLAIDEGARIAPEGALLILVRGMTLHNDVPLCVTMREMAFNQDVRAIVPKQGTDLNYLAYWLLAKKPMLLGLVDSAGHGTGRFHSDILKSLPIELPPLPEQRAIASILGAFDDKIELNRRMNETLESMAQALFKSWFIDFDPVRAKMRGEQPQGMTAEVADLFPDELVKSELGLIPKGWNIKPLSSVAELKTESVKPNESPMTNWEHYSIPAFDENNQPSIEVGQSIKSNKYSVPEHCVLVSKLNPRFPRVWLPSLQNPDVAICSTEFMPFVPHYETHRAFLFECIRSAPFQADMLSRTTGSTGSRQRVKPKEVAEIAITVPESNTFNLFDEYAKPLHDQIASNRDESVHCAQLRDTLLPQLLSGVLPVPAALTRAEEALA